MGFHDLIARWRERIRLKEEVRIVMPIAAISKARPRASRTGVFYTPKRTQDFEKAVAGYGRAVMGGRTLTSPLEVTVSITEKIPNSMPAARKWLARQGYIFPTRGDLDNKVKAIMDGLNGVVFVDDSQIVVLNSSKYYGDADEICVNVKQIGLAEHEVEQVVYSMKALTEWKENNSSRAH